MPKNTDGTFTLCKLCLTLEHMPIEYMTETAYDADADLSWLENGGPDPTDNEHAAYCAARLADYGVEWHMIGVIVTAYRNGEEIDSASLWGVESDSSKEYIAEIVADLTAEIAARIAGA